MYVGMGMCVDMGACVGKSARGCVREGAHTCTRARSEGARVGAHMHAHVGGRYGRRRVAKTKQPSPWTSW